MAGNHSSVSGGGPSPPIGFGSSSGSMSHSTSGSSSTCSFGSASGSGSGSVSGSGSGSGSASGSGCDSISGSGSGSGSTSGSGSGSSSSIGSGSRSGSDSSSDSALSFSMIWRKMCLTISCVWTAVCLFLFGAALGLMAAVSTQVGTTATLIAALVGLVGGSLVALYQNVTLSTEGQNRVIQAAGLISLGLIVGLYSGFRLRHYDQTYWMPQTVREWAALEQELSSKGLHVANFHPASTASDTHTANVIVEPSVILKATADREQLKTVRDRLEDVNVRIKNKTPEQVRTIKELVEFLTRLGANNNQLTTEEARRQLATLASMFRANFPDDGTLADQIEGIQIKNR